MDIRIFTEPQLGATYEEQLAVATVAEEQGYGGYFRADHLNREGTTSRDPGPTDVWMTLAGLARDTSTIRLGSLMTCSTFRWPGVLAITVAQVDVMSGGRVELGLGVGSFPGEHEALGIPMPPIGERFDSVAEELELLTGLWNAPVGEPYTYEGAHYQMRDYPALVRPAQSHVPIIIGGHGLKRTPALAARFADEFNIDGVGPEACAAAYGRVTRACEAIGRDPAEVTFSAVATLCCGTRSEDIRRRTDVIAHAVAGWKDPAEIIEAGLGGSPAEVIDRIGEFQAAGADRVYLQLFDLTDLDQLRLVAEEVLPHLAQQDPPERELTASVPTSIQTQTN
jgi:F420-dependent oxidoreductase-like protein